MSAIDVTNDAFTCHQEDDLAVITISKGSKIISTVSGKENMIHILGTIKTAPQIKGVAILYSDKYLGDIAYQKFLMEMLEDKDYKSESHYITTYQGAIIQFLKEINKFPKPIVGGMDGEIGPHTFAVNLAFDLRIATGNTGFFHPNLKFGLPPSPPLAYYLMQSLGAPRATELLLTKSKLTVQEVHDLGLISRIVSKEDLKKTCLDKLRQLSTISGDALLESRRMLQPDIDKLSKFIDEGFQGALRCLYKMRG